MELKLDVGGRPLLDQLSEEGFVDCVFKILDLKREQEYFVFRIEAIHDGESVGCTVRMIRGIQASLSDKAELISDRVYANGIVIGRSGDESDRLLMTLAKLYGLRNMPLRMCNSEGFTAIALHQNAVDVEREPVKLKLFGRDGDAEEYNESYFNVDFVNGFVFWNEKDPGYRVPLIEGLAA